MQSNYRYICLQTIQNTSNIFTTRDAGTTGAAGASAPHAFCIHNFLGAQLNIIECCGKFRVYNNNSLHYM